MSNYDAYLQEARCTIWEVLGPALKNANWGSMDDDAIDEFTGDLGAVIAEELDERNQLWYPKPRG